MIRTKDLIPGHKYRKTDFGIEGAAAMQSDCLIDGEAYIFFSLYSDKRNIPQPDGFVFEAADNRLPEKGRRVSCVRHVFLKKDETATEYTYMGPSVCEERYSDTQGKLLYAQIA